ncbi:MAG: TIGR02302 family protein [Sneathiella sp.]|nr:MAG: TIGR02302 family protein [Sneathiella sp.]
MLLVSAFIVAGPKAGERFVNAFSPNIGTPSVPLGMTAWITPPEYTGQAPILLKMWTTSDKTETPKSYVIPAGSRFIARVFGGNGDVPVLQKSTEILEFDRLDAQNFGIETSFETPGLAQINKGGDRVGAWQFNVVADAAPTISLLIPPDVTDRAAFRLQYRAQDDYGVASIGGEITRGNSDEKIKLALPAPGRGSIEIVGKSYHDLTAHPWAGLSVRLTLIAEDQIGQRGVSDVTTLILPERNFTHPIARALIEQRRNLVSDPVANKPTALIALEAIGLLPESLDGDFTAIMLLSAARSTLRYGDDQTAIDDVVEILWETALRLENGDLSMAEAALREAEQALMEALNSGASDNEIKKLMEELRAAMNAFLQALAQQQSDMAQSPTMDPDSQSQIIQSQDLQNLLDKIDQLARDGARDAARELLSELQDIMENLKAADSMQLTADQQAMQQMLNELGEMMQKQQKLLDETMRESQKGAPGSLQQGGQQPQPGQSGQGSGLQGLAQNQEALRQMLQDLLGRLGEQGDIPKELGQAGKSMKDARDALGKGQGEGAMQSENQALDSLRRGAQSLAQQMMQGQGQGEQSAGTSPQRPSTDPLGRRFGGEEGIGGNFSTDSVETGAKQIGKTRAIRDEVQRRLSDPSRDLLEREYLKRLLDFF